MKGMGEANLNFGIKIIKTYDVLMLLQEHYVEKLLRKFRYYDCKTVSTSFNGNTNSKKNVEHSVDKVRHA